MATERINTALASLRKELVCYILLPGATFYIEKSVLTV